MRPANLVKLLSLRHGVGFSVYGRHLILNTEPARLAHMARYMVRPPVAAGLERGPRPPPEKPCELERGSSGWCARWIHRAARSADQTKYRFRDRPVEVRVTHPPSPLFGELLPVVCPRREQDETYWICRLPDGSTIRMPMEWTDHPGASAAATATRAGGRAIDTEPGQIV